MRYCKKCVMPDTRPYLKFDDEGVCYPCRAYEHRKEINWEKRWAELEKLADQHRGLNGDYYDCIIAASGGKDSHYQTHIFKEKLKMNPLLVSIDNFSWTQTGRYNWDNIRTRFGVDAHMLSLNPQVCKNLFRKAFEKLGSPTWYFDRAIYAYPLQIAIKLHIPLIVYGENTSYERGGPLTEDVPGALSQINNDVVKPVPWDFWLDDTVHMKDVNPTIYPRPEEIKKAKLNPIFLSYFVPWDSHGNYEFAKRNGFKSLDDTGEWKREGLINNYDQIDTIGYITHTWLKFIKFGHWFNTDYCSVYIREGRMTRKEAVKYVLENEHKLDRKMLADFLAFIGYTDEQFWKVVDRFANRDIVEKRDGQWRLKKNVEEALRNGGVVKP